MKRTLASVAVAMAAVLLVAAPSQADDEPVDNGTGGGSIPGAEPDYPAGYEKDLQVKLATWDAYAEALETGEPIDPSIAPESLTRSLSPKAQGRLVSSQSTGPIDEEERPPCDSENPCPLTKRVLSLGHRGQTNNFYCGPATGVMIADYRNKPTSAFNGVSLGQSNMAGANHMQTHVAGDVTPYSSNNWTEGMNRWLRGTTTGYYSQVNNPGAARFRSALRYDIDDYHPFGVSTVEFEGESSYNGHNTSNQTVGHWVVAFGYSESLGKVHLKDPATTVWSATQPSIVRATNVFVNTYVDNGISA